jgi:sugar-specific transcriptional regulator TrmB
MSEVEDLVDFGLTVLQARAYVALLRLGNARASQISSAIGTVRPETYRVLRELALKGLVERSPGLPSIFIALPPNRTVPLLLAHFRNRFRELEHKQNGLIKSLRSQASGIDNSLYRIGLTFTTADNFQQRNILLIKHARRDYAAIISKFGLSIIGGGVLAEDYMQALIHAKRRGVRMRMISEVDAHNLRYADSISHHVEMRKFSDIQFYFQIFDKREMIFGPASTVDEINRPEKSTRNADLWTNNRKFIDGTYAIFEKLWSVSCREPGAPE